MEEGKNTEKKKDPTIRTAKILTFATVVLAAANVVLVCLTYRYLKETEAQRLVAQRSIELTEKTVEAAHRSIELTEKSFEFETSPKPYIKDVETKWRLSEENTLLGFTSIKLANCGRREATNIRLHTIVKKGSLTDEQTRKLVEYLYPGQEPLYAMLTLKIECTPEVIAAIKEGKALKIPKDKQEPISLKIELMYDEPTGRPRMFPYDLEYNYALSKWVPAGFGTE